MGPVMDHQRPGLGHAQAEVVQGLKEGGILRPVPQDAGLVLIEAVVLPQGLGVSGPQLADGQIQELPPGGRPLPDQVQVLRAEQHRGQNARELPGGLQPHPVGVELPAFPPVQLGLQGEGPAPAVHCPLQKGPVDVQHDHLPVVPGPVGLGGGQIGDGLQQVGLALGVLPVDQIHPGVEVRLEVDIVPKKIQLQSV